MVFELKINLDSRMNQQQLEGRSIVTSRDNKSVLRRCIKKNNHKFKNQPRATTQKEKNDANLEHIMKYTDVR